jgi:uncharacterized LabA/DUF88 family protein
MIQKYVRGKTIVFIDAANLENSVKYLNWWIDYRKLYEFFKFNTNLVGIYHYCIRLNDERQDKFFTVLKRTGFKLITKPVKIIDKFNVNLRKANFDVEIALDAYQALKEYDTLVLFSGDSDFDYLVKKLRKEGKRVIIISTRYHVSKELIASCNKYIDLKKLRVYIERLK